MFHYGDVTKINGATVPKVDIITFGAPCQDLSIAGKRAGMKNTAHGDDETTRSGLFFEAIRIIKEMRDDDRRTNGRTNEFLRPRFAVYENVCGALSSNKGEDFRVVLEETARIADKDAVIPGLAKGQKWSYSGCIMGDGWSIAWRVHDAQFWGVPQRRKRIALVADFGGTSAPEILFERKGLSGDTEQSEQEGQAVTRETEDSVGTTINNGSGPKVMCIGNGQAHMQVTEKVGTLNCMHDQQAVVYGISPYESNSMKSSNPHSGVYEAATARTLDNNGGSPACNQGGMLILDKHNLSVNEDKTQTLIQGEKNKDVPFVSYGLDRASYNQGQNAQFDFSVEEELAPTIVSKGPGGVMTRQ